MSDKVLQVKNVIKSYGDYKASNNISFDVMRGTVFGLLGPNGAGKTTLIRLINNIYVPDEGEILIFNEKLNVNHLNKMAYLPEERGLYKKLKVIDQLIYFGKLKGMSTKRCIF
jgi:ABC-2 type transport system ATP-binding protein